MDPTPILPQESEVEAIEVHHLGPGRDEVAARTSSARPRCRRLRPARGAASSSRRRGRRACRSTSARRSCDRGLRTASFASDVGFHSVPMSSRFTKKSLVSVSGRLVKTPCFDLADVGVQHAQAADEHRHLRRGQRQQLRLVDQQRLGRDGVPRLLSSCGSRRRPARARRTTSTSVCSCDASVRPGVNGTVTVVAGVLRRLLDRRAAAQHDQVGQRDLLAAGRRAVERRSGCPRASSSTFASCAGWLTSQSFCGARRMRAPFAPPRLSEPRNVDADAHAVETSCEIGQAGREDLRLQRGDVLVVDQLVIDRGDRVLPDEFLRRDLRAEVARARAHVAVRELEPRAGERVGELVGIAPGSAARSFRTPGRTRSARSVVSIVGAMRLRRVVRVGHRAVAGAVLRPPLVRAGRALRQFPLVAEQVLEEVVAPLRRRGGPGDFQAAGDRVAALAGAEAVLPAEALLLEAGRLRARARRATRAPRRASCRRCGRRRSARRSPRRSSPCGRRSRGCPCAAATGSGLPFGPSGLT